KVAFDLENAGIDREWTVGFARPVCIVGTSQINRCRIEDRVLRFIRCGRWTRIAGKNVPGRKRESHKADESLCHSDLEPGRGLSRNQVQNRSSVSACVSRAGFGFVDTC